MAERLERPPEAPRVAARAEPVGTSLPARVLALVAEETAPRRGAAA